MTDAYIVDYLRTPFGRYGGSLSAVRPDDLAAGLITSLVSRHSEMDCAEIGDVILGCANQAGEDNRNVARMATLLSGLPMTVPASTVNRLCGSSLDAIAIASAKIKIGEADLVIAGGVESMSRAPFVMPKSASAFSRQTELHDTTMGWRFVNPMLRDQYGVESMGQTAENVALDFAVSRVDQDAFAVRSHQRAVRAMGSGRFSKEIAPVSIPQGKGSPVLVAQDEHPRADSNPEQLAKLKTLFSETGTVTAGNASGINDGAAMLLIASEDAIKRHGLTPKARIMGSAVVGLEPRIMGFGPSPAARKLMARLGCCINDFDVLEINEAFASQALAVTRDLGLDDDAEHVNPNGGAIALGHPLGASGARICGTAAVQLEQINAKKALMAMCIGVGQGIALAIENVT